MLRTVFRYKSNILFNFKFVKTVIRIKVVSSKTSQVAGSNITHASYV